MTQTISVSKKNFRNKLLQWASNNPAQRGFVTLDVPVTAHYLLDIGGNAGVGITQEGELIALFNDSAPQGTGGELVEKAKQEGADHLYCFDVDSLVAFYQKHGFRITDRYSWDPDKAPSDWNYSKYGKPDLVKMEL